MVRQEVIRFQTVGRGDMKDLTLHVKEIVRKSGVRVGLAHIFNVGSTAAVGAIEFEPGLQRDLPELLDRLIPPGKDYGHEQAWHDGNSHSHLQSTLLGQAFTAPVRDGELVVGTWQQIVHVDLDIKPRERTLVVTVMGE